MGTINPTLDDSWKAVLQTEFNAEYFSNLKQTLIEEKKVFSIYPPGKLIFNAFNSTPLHKVKVVILGQDPYHGEGQAHGLSFSVPKGIRQPPSLKNIVKELIEDVQINPTTNGDLSKWAEQGVFLLNAFLTVRKSQAGSHSKIGWEQFTNAVIKAVSDHTEHVVFILWGNFAKQKAAFIDTSKHLIITSTHPSPFSANNGFFGSKPFSKTNDYLISKEKTPIDWNIE